MRYRRLSAELVSSLESDSTGLPWPPYRTFRRFSIQNRFAFAEREYSRLRRLHIGLEELVESLITYLRENHETPMVTAMPVLQSLPRHEWLDHLSEFVDGGQMRRQDYYRGVTWRELPLLMMLGDGRDQDRSFCRNEATARSIADAQYIEVAKSLSSSSQWRKHGVNNPALKERLGDSPAEFAEMISRLWTSIPETVWLAHSRNSLIGGSVIVPLVASAYERLQAGALNDQDLDPEHDLQLPSRDLFVMAMTELPNRPRARLPGVKTALQTRKFLQHCAVLLGDSTPSSAPVRILVAIGSKRDEKAIERIGLRPLGRNMPGSTCPLYEMIIPPPETTLADYTSAEATIATMIGTYWRMLRGK